VVRKIERDANRSRDRPREDQERPAQYITHGEMIGKTGGELVSIPCRRSRSPSSATGRSSPAAWARGPATSAPRSAGPRARGRAGPGRRQPRPPHPGGRADPGRAGRHPGRGLELPRIQPKGRANIIEDKDKYTGIRQAGPESLRHFKRTYKKALKRQIASNTYNRDDPVVIPVREDKQYRSWNPVPLPHTNAVVLYLMDVSGSMTDDQKEIVRIEAFWIDTWLRSQYDGVTTRYVIHDAVAKEVDQHTFYHTRESGGTRISSGLRPRQQDLEADHPAADWNIYVLHFSDGDNWGEDNRQCVGLLEGPAPAQVQPVRLRPGGEPLRLGRVLPRAGGGLRGYPEPGAVGDPQ
jgi:hypothetical protein